MAAGVVFSYSERPELAGEVAAAASKVAEGLGTGALAVEVDEVSAGMRSRCEVVLVKGDRVLEADADSTTDAIAKVAKERGFSALLVGETRFGTLVAAKVAARLKVGSLGKGKGLRLEGGRLVTSRDVYGGRFLATVASKLPCIALVQPGVYSPEGAAPRIAETVTMSAKADRVAIVGTIQDEQPDVDIRSAATIVAAGRGFAKKEDLALARALAAELGAALGCSRPLSSDLGWLGEDQHIGLTGAYVSPKLYVAVGISGQLQHIAGIKDSKVIVAINSDGRAPIFQTADYGIVGDLYQVVPALIKALKAR